METIRVKPTRYNGYKFRSRLEARWAVFFDLAGIKYIYEPDTYICENGEQYTPDFLLPEAGLRAKGGGVYIEVKPINYTRGEINSLISPFFFQLIAILTKFKAPVGIVFIAPGAIPMLHITLKAIFTNLFFV